MKTFTLFMFGMVAVLVTSIAIGASFAAYREVSQTLVPSTSCKPSPQITQPHNHRI